MMEGHDVPFDYEAHAANIAKKAKKNTVPLNVIKEESSNMNTLSDLNKVLKKEKGWTGLYQNGKINYVTRYRTDSRRF